MKEQLKYQTTHEWIKVDGLTAKIGITSYAAMHLGDINYIRLPNVNQVFKKGESFAEIESIKNTSSLYMPTDATVIKVNTAVVDNPLLVNDDPFANYLIEISFTNVEDINALMNVEEYEATL